MRAVDELVDRYMRDLERELEGLPASRRRDLVDEIRGHIDADLGPAPTEADVRTVLERIGDPAEIAAEERERLGTTPPRERRGRLVEVLALVFLTAGSFVIPFVGWLAGAVLLWASSVWTLRDKLLGTAFVPGGLLPAFVLALGDIGGSGCTEISGPSGRVESTCAYGGEQAAWTAVFVLMVVLPIATWIYLAVRLRRLTA